MPDSAGVPAHRPSTPAAAPDETWDDAPAVTLTDALSWLGEDRRLLGAVAAGCTAVALAVALALPNVYTARATLLPPGNSQSGGSAAAMAALGALSGLAGGLSAKTPDELYVSLLRSDSVLRALDQQFELRKRLDVDTFEELRREFGQVVRVTSDRKSGVITVEVDDKDPAFAAKLANAHGTEITRVLSRLAVSEAQQRRVFFEQQLNKTKENLVAAEDAMRRLQEKSGVIVLDKQAEALLQGAALIRAQIAEREVQLSVLRSGATSQNPDVMRVSAELRALRSELARMEAANGGRPGSAVEMPVGRLPEASIDYVRARRELKLQEVLLESLVRQLEIARLDEAKEGPLLQPVDRAEPPDRKSKPRRALIVLGGAFGGVVLGSLLAMARGASRQRAGLPSGQPSAWDRIRTAWGWRASGRR